MPEGTCYCGAQTSGFHSGRYECGSCWDWRKLDSPAATHWARVSAEFLSNVDMYDLSKFFGKAGLTAFEVEVMLGSAAKLRAACEGMIVEHHPSTADQYSCADVESDYGQRDYIETRRKALQIMAMGYMEQMSVSFEDAYEHAIVEAQS